MNLFLYLLLILLSSVAITLAIVRINADATEKIKKITQEKKELLQEYNELYKEIKELKKTIKDLNNQIKEEKHQAQLKSLTPPPPKEEKKPLTPLEFLQENGIITEEHIKKAKDFINKSNSNFEMLEVLLLLGYIDQNQYNQALEETK